MSVRNDIVNLLVNVNGNTAQKNLNDLRKKAADVKAEMEGLKKGTQAYIDKSKELKGITGQMDALKKQIGITSLSMRELGNERKRLNALLSQTVPGTKEFKAYEAQLNAVIVRQKQVSAGVNGFTTAASKIKSAGAGLFSNLAGFFGITAALGAINRVVSGGIKLSDQLADLRRVAGLTKNEANALNDSLLKLDTRTSGEGLLNIAIIAGKLGVAKEDILGFTESVDRLVVALGDELGDADQITTELGKILNVFDGTVTGENISFLGNAIVELGNAGVATGGFITDFTQRVAGIAKASNLSLGSTLGLAAGFEELGLRSESSSTALQKLLSTIAGDIPKAAKIAGVPLKEFQALFAEKPQEALIKYAEGLTKNKASFEEITASFKDAGEDGARVVQTLQAIGQRADFLRQKIDQGNAAMTRQNALLEAERLKNDTLAGSIEKVGKQWDKLIASKGIGSFLKETVDQVNGLLNAVTDMANDGVWDTFLNFSKGWATWLFKGNEAFKEFQELRKGQREVTKEEVDATRNFDFGRTKTPFPTASISGAITPITAGVDTSVKNTIGLIQELQDAIKKLDDELPKLTTEKAIAENIKQRDKLQRELDRLQGKQDKAMKKMDDDVVRLKKEWQDLQKEINAGFALDDPFSRGITAANKLADEEKKKLDELLAKKIITDQQYADSSVLIEQVRLDKIKKLVQQYVKDTGDNRFAPGVTTDNAKALTATNVDALDTTDIEAALARKTRDVIAGEELTAMKEQGRVKLQAQLNLLELQKAQELDNANLTENEIANIKEKFRQQEKEATVQYFVDRANAILDFSSQLLNTAATINDALTAAGNRQLAQEQKQNDLKLARYKKLLDAKLISEKKYNSLVAKADQELAKKKHEIDVKTFKRQQALAIISAIINGAQGVTATFAARPGLADIFSLGVARAIQVGLIVASTAAQIAAISSQKPPEAAKGGVFKGPSHKEGGMTVYDNRTGKPAVEVEGGEPFMVLSKNTLKNNGALISALLDTSINRNGAPLIPRWKTQRYPQINLNKMLPVLAAGGVVNNVSSTSSTAPLIANATDPETKELLKAILFEQQANREALNNFNGRLKADVVLKDITDKQVLLDRAKAASGINKN